MVAAKSAKCTGFWRLSPDKTKKKRQEAKEQPEETEDRQAYDRGRTEQNPVRRQKTAEERRGPTDHGRLGIFPPAKPPKVFVVFHDRAALRVQDLLSGIGCRGSAPGHADR